MDDTELRTITFKVSIAEAEELAVAVQLFAAERAVAVAVAIVDPDGGVV